MNLYFTFLCFLLLPKEPKLLASVVPVFPPLLLLLLLLRYSSKKSGVEGSIGIGRNKQKLGVLYDPILAVFSRQYKYVSQKTASIFKVN